MTKKNDSTNIKMLLTLIANILRRNLICLLTSCCGHNATVLLPLYHLHGIHLRKRIYTDTRTVTKLRAIND